MTTATESAEVAAAPDDPPDGESAADQGSADESAATPPPRDDNDFATPVEDTAGRSLPSSALHAYYGVPPAGAATGAFGPGATAIGTLHLTQPRGPDGFVSGQLSESDVGEMVRTYAGTESDEELRERLAARSVVYLSGKPGSGVRTTATVLLARQHGHDRVASLMPLVERASVHLIGEASFLLDGYGHILDPGSEVKLESVHLDALETKAHRIGATVIVLSRSDDRDDELSRHRVRQQRPDNREVFRRWLGYRLVQAGRCVGDCDDCGQRCHDAYVARCLNDAGVAAQLLAAWRMTDVVELADHCAREVSDPGEPLRIPEDAIGRRRQASQLLDVDWEQLGGKRAAQHLQAFRIAYALLHEVSITHVFDAVGRLVHELDKEQRRRPIGRSVLELDVDELLGPGMQPGDTGEAAAAPTSGIARRAQLRDPRLAAYILDVAWHDYDSLRGPLLSWILDLGGHPDPTVRQYVAAATGRLCGYDFQEIREQVVESWAEGEPRTRYTAALALESAAYNEHLTVPVLRYVRRLVLSRSRHRCDVAVRFYATPYGRTFYPYALADLERVARDPRQEFNGAVAGAAVGLYDADTAADLLPVLCRWAGMDGPAARHADRCFVQLARLMADHRDDRRDGWPLLLADAQAGDSWPVRREQVAALWRSSLLGPSTAARAWEALEYWLNSADRQPAVVEPLADLLACALTDPPLRRRTRFHLSRLWRRRMPDNPLLDRLDELVRSPGRPS
jgi:hypothetical protein